MTVSAPQGRLFTPRERWVIRLEPGQDRVPHLTDCFDRAKGDILAVCGEMDPALWEDERLIQALRRFLSREKENRFVVAFSRETDCKTPEQAEESLRQRNPNLIDMAMKRSEAVQIYWLPQRPEAHYALCNSSVMLESGHSAYGKPRVTFILDDPDFANERGRIFWGFIKYKRATLLPLASQPAVMNGS